MILVIYYSVHQTTSAKLHTLHEYEMSASLIMSYKSCLITTNKFFEHQNFLNYLPVQ